MRKKIWLIVSIVYFQGLVHGHSYYQFWAYFLSLLGLSWPYYFPLTVGHLFWPQLVLCASNTRDQSAWTGCFHHFLCGVCLPQWLWKRPSDVTRRCMHKGNSCQWEREGRSQQTYFSLSWDTFSHLRACPDTFQMALWVDFPRHQLNLFTAHVASKM